MSCSPQNLPFQIENAHFEGFEHCAVTEATLITQSRSSAGAREASFSARPPIESLPFLCPAKSSFLSVRITQLPISGHPFS
jgi:hypothetical protein